MNKIILLFILLVSASLVNSVPVVFGHTESMGMKLFVGHQETSTTNSFNQEDNSQDSGIEFLSNEWFWKNFILLLSGSITAIVVSTFVLVYRKEV